MLELIIDSCDRRNIALIALRAANIAAEEGECMNTIRVSERDMESAEVCMDNNGIEWQWSSNEDGTPTVT